MADLVDHYGQAQHNEEFAESLNAQPDLAYWDWLITVSFYAAVHYVEAYFSTVSSLGHSEQACGKLSPHTFRARAVKEHLRACWRSYRKLQDASWNVRYLALANQGQSGLAVSYYSRRDASRMYDVHLDTIRETVNKKLNPKNST